MKLEIVGHRPNQQSQHGSWFRWLFRQECLSEATTSSGHGLELLEIGDDWGDDWRGCFLLDHGFRYYADLFDFQLPHKLEVELSPEKLGAEADGSRIWERNGSKDVLAFLALRGFSGLVEPYSFGSSNFPVCYALLPTWSTKTVTP